MYLWHPTIAYFAIAFFVTAMLTEGAKLLTGKRFWGLVSKYHLLAATVMALLAVITGIMDFQHTWGTYVGYRFLKAHAMIGFLVFIIIQMLAGYRYFMAKMLPEKYAMIYLVVGGLGLGLTFGASYLGREAVYTYGSGVRAAMLDFLGTEEYLKHLYGLDSLRTPTAQDSLRAAQYHPEADTLEVSDTLAYHEQAHGVQHQAPTQQHQTPLEQHHAEPVQHPEEHHQQAEPANEHSGHH